MEKSKNEARTRRLLLMKNFITQGVLSKGNYCARNYNTSHFKLDFF
jgi:hypothetical protein